MAQPRCPETRVFMRRLGSRWQSPRTGKVYAISLKGLQEVTTTPGQQLMAGARGKMKDTPEAEKIDTIKARIRALVTAKKMGQKGEPSRSYLMPDAFRSSFLGSKSRVVGILFLERSLEEWEWILAQVETVVLPAIEKDTAKHQAVQEAARKKKGLQ